jgi:hypothetical protein
MWKEAVDKDSCVADQAAAVSYSEVSGNALSTHRFNNDTHGIRHLRKQWWYTCTGFSTIHSPLTHRTLLPVQSIV